MDHHPLESFVRSEERIVAAPMFRFSYAASYLEVSPRVRIVNEGHDDWGQLGFVLQKTSERSQPSSCPIHSIECDWTEYQTSRELAEKAFKETEYSNSSREGREGLDLWLRWREELGIEDKTRRSLLLAIRAVGSTLACLRLLGSSGVSVPGLVLYERSWKNGEIVDRLCEASITLKEDRTDYAGLVVTPELETAIREPLTLDPSGADDVRRLAKLAEESNASAWSNVCDRWNELHSLNNKPAELCFKAVPLLEHLLPALASRSLPDALAVHGETLMPGMERERIYRRTRALVDIRHAMAHGKSAPELHARIAPQLADFALNMCRASVINWLQST